MKLIIALAVVLAALLAGLAMVFEAPSRLGDVIPALLGLGYAGAVTLILRGPLGKALARELTEEPQPPALPPGDSGQWADLAMDVQGNRQELLELQERLEFAERLLAQRAGVPPES